MIKFENGGVFHAMEYKVSIGHVLEFRKLNGPQINGMDAYYVGNVVTIKEKLRYLSRRYRLGKFRIMSHKEVENLPQRRLNEYCDDAVEVGFFENNYGVNPILMKKLKLGSRKIDGKYSRIEFAKKLIGYNIDTYQSAALSLSMKKDSFVELLHAIGRRALFQKYNDELEIIDLGLLKEMATHKIEGRSYSSESDKMLALHEFYEKEFDIQLKQEFCFVTRSMPTQMQRKLAKRQDILLNRPVSISNSVLIKPIGAPNLPNTYTSNLFCLIYEDELDRLWNSKAKHIEFDISGW